MQTLKEKLQNKNIKTIWEGELYETNSSITLDTALEEGALYILSFRGLSATYLTHDLFIYDVNFIQSSLNNYDGSSYARIRISITNNGKTLTVNDNTINNSANTALIKISKINL